MNFILVIVAFISIGDAGMMVIRGLPHVREMWGFMQGWCVLTNASLDACFLALMSPIVLIREHRNKWRFAKALLLGTAIILSKSNTALFCLLVMWSTIWFFCKPKLSKEFLHRLPIIEFLAGLCALSYPLYYFLGAKLGEGYGRFQNWNKMIGFWYHNLNHTFGAGPGSYWIYSQSVQIHKIGDPVMTWMHNDWLQVLFEQGIVGLTAVSLLFVTMLWKSRRSPILFSMVLGYGIIASTMFPLHLFFFQLSGVALIYHCFVNDKLEGVICQTH